MQQRFIILGMLKGQKWVSMRNQTRPKFEKIRRYLISEFDQKTFLQNFQRVLFRHHQWKKNLIHPRHGQCGFFDLSDCFPDGQKKNQISNNHFCLARIC